MVSEKELHRLFAAAQTKGAAVAVSYDSEGFVRTVTISGARGIGPHPMSPIGAAERLREFTARV
jgi:hypothetical protein